MRQLAYSISVLLVFSGCAEDLSENGGVVVATAYGNDLYRSELTAVIPSDIDAEDSAAMASSYINSWLRKATILENARVSFTEDDPEFESKVENYRNSLLIYSFEKAWVEQKMDTAVHADSLSSYFERNRDKFKLKEDILKLSWFSIPNSINAPKDRKLLDLLKSDEPEDKSKLDRLLAERNTSIQDYDGAWVRYQSVLKDLPLTSTDLKRGEASWSWVISKDDRRYFVRLLGARTTAAEAPLELVSKEIQSILLNKRKAAVLEKMKNDLFEEAKRNGDITIH